LLYNFIKLDFTFYKYQGTGNDFVLIDNRLNFFNKKDTKLVAKLCDRRFGVGADGLILLEDSSVSDFKMIYFNADGNQSTMCGNGGRCIVSFAQFLNIIDSKTSFEAIDGLHNAEVKQNSIALQMIDVLDVEEEKNHSFLDTGSPHHVQFVSNVKDFDVKTEGAKIRYSDLYNTKGGSNINFVEQLNDSAFRIRTYERGVEDETLSCGTGATATAIAMHKAGKTSALKNTIEVEGGTLTIQFKEDSGIYSNVYLEGPATQVFKGVFTW